MKQLPQGKQGAPTASRRDPVGSPKVKAGNMKAGNTPAPSAVTTQVAPRLKTKRTPKASTEKKTTKDSAAAPSPERIGAGKPGPGRPRGAPNKITREIKTAAAEHGAHALGVLLQIMDGKRTPAATRVAAAREVLDRGFGRPGVSVNVQGELGGTPTPDVLAALAESMRAARERQLQALAERRELGFPGD